MKESSATLMQIVVEFFLKESSNASVERAGRVTAEIVLVRRFDLFSHR